MANRINSSYSNKRYSIQIGSSIINQAKNHNLMSSNTLSQSENYISDINDIFSKIKAESASNVPSTSYSSITLLSFYIRRNRHNLVDIIKKISFFFNSNSDINYRILVNGINTVLNLLIENNHIINFINMILPILVNYLTFYNQSISAFEAINYTIGRLLKTGGIFIKQIIEKNIESLMIKFSKEKELNTFKYENTKFALIQYLCKIMENASLYIFNKIKEKATFEIFLGILDYYKDPKPEIRYITGELVKQFIHILNDRDSKTKNEYLKIVYNYIYSQYVIHAQENNSIPNNSDLVSGFLIILQKIYFAEPSFFKDTALYTKLVDNLMKCKNCLKNNVIRIEFIKFIPKLLQMNKDLFIDYYLKGFLEFANSLLNLKTTVDIRNTLFLTLGTLSLAVDRELFDSTLKNLLALIKVLFKDKNILDKEMIKCLSDLFNNKDNIYLEAIRKELNLFEILKKLFKTSVSAYQLEFLQSIMSSFKNHTREHISTAITSLNVVSLILFDEHFELDYFYQTLDQYTEELISPQLKTILSETTTFIRKNIVNQNTSSLNIGVNLNMFKNIMAGGAEPPPEELNKRKAPIYIKCRCLKNEKLIIDALSLFSKVKNSLFCKDMLVFFQKKILLYLNFGSSKIIKKILDLIKCKFINIYEDDYSFSAYYINNILDAIFNLYLLNDDITVLVYAINACNKKTIFYDFILKEKDINISKLIGALSNSFTDEYIKEKLIQSIGIIANSNSIYNDKKYFITSVRKNIKRFLYTIENTEDIIQKENMVNLLLYYHKYLKNYIDFNLIENTMEALLYLMLGDYQGYLVINILKVVCEILDNDLTKKNIGDNKKFDEYCQIILTICIINIKETGVNTIKSEISLQTMYQIIKLQKINIYKDYNPQLSQALYSKKHSNNNNGDFSPKKLLLTKDSENFSKIDEDDSKNLIAQHNYLMQNLNNDFLDNNIYAQLFGGKGGKINLVEILLQSVIKGASDESLKSIMNIFGLCGALEPTQMEKYFSFFGLSIYNLEGNATEEELFEENDFKINRFNPKTKSFIEIDLSKIDISTIKAVMSLMRLLKDNTQQELRTRIITHLGQLIKSLSTDESNLIDIILPDIIEVIPTFEVFNQKNLFENILIIITQFKNKIRYYLDDIIQLIKDFITNENHYEIISNILKKLMQEFIYELEKYYTILIPIFISLIKTNKNNNKFISSFVEFFSILAKNKNISCYIGLVLEELCLIYLDASDEQVIMSLLDIFQQLVRLANMHFFFPLIIKALIEKFKLIVNPKYYTNQNQNNNSNIILNLININVDLNKFTKERKLEYLFKTGPLQSKNILTLSKSFDIFIEMNEANSQHFLGFLPLIVTTCCETGIILYAETKTKIKDLLIDYNNFTFMDIGEFNEIIKSQLCKVNCIFGYHSLSNNIKKNELDIYSDDIWSKPRFRQSVRIKKTKEDNIIIIKQFDTSYCSVEEDWNEWFKSTSKILFKQSPIYPLYICHVIADYYFPLVIELYNYGFLSIYENMSENNKMILINNLIKAVSNNKTPNDILLNILNLSEFFERRNVHLQLIDYKQFGNIAYKCRAFAKALYYKENEFIKRNDFDHFEDLLELYYELKYPESAIGLLKLAEKSKDMYAYLKNKSHEKANIYNDEYILYIKLHEYDKALKMIKEQLVNEKNEEKIEILKKNKDICLNGLCDWEELFNDEEISMYNIGYDSESDEESLEEEKPKERKRKETRSEKVIQKEKDDKKEEEDGSINKIIDKEILLSKACMNLSKWPELKRHFTKIQKLFKNNNDMYEQIIMNNKDDVLNFDFDANKEEDDEIEQNNFYNSHGLIKNKIIDILTDDTDNYNKYLLLNNHKSRKRINTGSITVGKHRLSDRGSTFGLADIFTDNDFIAYNEVISKNPSFSFLEGKTEILFDLDLYSIILNINNGQFDIALKFINSAKKIIVNGIKPLLSESYGRGYELLVKNQLLFQLEQIIEYKQFHEKDEKYLKQMISIWDQNLNIIGKDPDIYEKILSVRSLVLPIEDEFENYINLSKMYRKLNMYEQSEKILKRIRDQLRLDSFDLGTNTYTLNSSRIPNKTENDTIIELNDDGGSDKSEFKLIKNDLILTKQIKIEIELNYNQCLYEQGKIFDAIGKSKYLVELLDRSEGNTNYNTDLNKLSDKIKSKIYGDYAIYKHNQFHKNLNVKTIKKIKKKTMFNDKNQFKKMKTIGLGKKTKSVQMLDLRKSLNVKKTTEEMDDKSDVNNINKYFILSTKFNQNSYKLWHSYALFNYKYYKYLSKHKLSKIDEILLVGNAVEGFKHSLIIGGKNKNKTFQDLLRLLDTFFTSGIKNYELLSLISDTLDVVEVEAYLNVLPQLLCRFDIKDKKVLDILINILIKIGTAHPQAVIYSFIVMKLSSSKKRQSAAGQILYSICKNNPLINDLVKECEMFTNEINKCAMLLHEEWFETLENTSKMYYTKDYQGMVKYLHKLHEKAKEKPETMYELHFYQKYGSDIKEAGYYLKDFVENQNLTSLHQAWDIYLNIYTDINEKYSKFETISLEYVSSKLHHFQDSKICLPGSYSIGNENYLKLNKLIRIQKMGKILKVFNTKQHPRKISMIGTDNKEYLFLLKGHEDLRQDERAMQLFNLVNTILANDKSTSNKNLNIITYAVFPLSPNTGIIGWVPNCDTLNQLIKEQRSMSNIALSIEHRKIFKTYPRFESSVMMNKIELFQDALNETQGMEINNMIWIKARNCETWLKYRTNYSRSLAVMSIVGYILGLGDRHPSNLMLSKKTGQIIHIDFGDCFEVAMKREKFPEKVPFRLTRMLVKALEVSGIEGTFRIISEKVMELLRNNKDSLLAILGSFLYDPLISFRLMIPMILKTKNKNKNYSNNDEIFISEEDIRQNAVISKSLPLPKVNFDSICQLLENKISDKKKGEKKPFVNDNNKNLIKDEDESNELDLNKKSSNEINFIKLGRQNDIKRFGFRKKITLNVIMKTPMNQMVGVSESVEKDAKKKMEDDERQIFNLYEENDEIDEIDSEQLNNIAQIVLDRIQDKLSGTDFNPNIIYDVKNQVDELIKSATSYENLAQSYLGWCPFW